VIRKAQMLAPQKPKDKDAPPQVVAGKQWSP